MKSLLLERFFLFCTFVLLLFLLGPWHLHYLQSSINSEIKQGTRVLQMWSCSFLKKTTHHTSFDDDGEKPRTRGNFQQLFQSTSGHTITPKSRKLTVTWRSVRCSSWKHFQFFLNLRQLLHKNYCYTIQIAQKMPSFNSDFKDSNVYTMTVFLK